MEDEIPPPFFRKKLIKIQKNAKSSLEFQKKAIRWSDVFDQRMLRRPYKQIYFQIIEDVKFCLLISGLVHL